MTLHLIKLCVGADSIEDLSAWTKRRAAESRKAGGPAASWHVTRMFPRRTDALLDGGSLYWVIRGVVLARQMIIGLEPETGEDGTERCRIVLSGKVVPTLPLPKRAFQGWRYLRPEDAPADAASGRGASDPALGARLAELGLL